MACAELAPAVACDLIGEDPGDIARCYNTSGGFLHESIEQVRTDAQRVGAITQFLKFATLAEHRNLGLAPHFAMDIHAHLAAAYPIEPWVEHVDWLYPPFNERLETRNGRMYLSDPRASASR